jgi:hypothetical protein
MTNGNGHGHPTGRDPVEQVVDLFVHMPIGFAVMAWKRVPALVLSVPEMVGQAVSKGCAQIAEAEERLSEEVRKARMIGQVAVTFGGRQLRREVDARLADARQAAAGVATFLPGAGADGGHNGAGARPDGPTVTAAATPTAPASPVAAPVAPAATPTAAKAPAKPAGARKSTKAVPVKATKATAATKKSPGAAPNARAAGRPAARTAAPASAADLPIREYDGLSASQVVSRLTGLTPEELRAICSYEEANRGRRTVLLAIDRLLV